MNALPPPAVQIAAAALQRERDHHAARIEEIDGVLAHLQSSPVERSSGPTPRRRFRTLSNNDPATVTGLPEGHPALVEKRTLFPSSVVTPAQSERLLVSGEHNRKLGDRIVKGPWKGMPLFHLTLEERKTCPEACFNWRTCYGNGMPKARRHSTEEIEARLIVELVDLGRRYPGGFVVRLHTLGDFFSVDYVDLWKRALLKVPPLHVFGYTAHPRDSEIGQAIYDQTCLSWDRFAIRFSSKDPAPQGATTIFRRPESATVPEGIVCPAETGATDCCGTCGLCWAPGARDKTIVFVAHGQEFLQPVAPSTDGAAPTTPQKGTRATGRLEVMGRRIVEKMTKLASLGERVNGVNLGLELNVSRPQILEALKYLNDIGTVVRLGNGRATEWRLTTMPTAAAPARSKWGASADPEIHEAPKTATMCRTPGCRLTRQPGRDLCAGHHTERLSIGRRAK